MNDNSLGEVEPISLRVPVVILLETAVLNKQQSSKENNNQITNHLLEEKIHKMSEEYLPNNWVVDISIIAFSIDGSVSEESFTLDETYIEKTHIDHCSVNDALLRGIEKIKKKREIYQNNGMHYKLPQIYLFSDGENINPNLGDGVKNILSNDNKNIVNFTCVKIKADGKENGLDEMVNKIQSGPNALQLINIQDFPLEGWYDLRYSHSGLDQPVEIDETFDKLS